MKKAEVVVSLDKRQQRYLKLLFKFRFVSAWSLSQVLGTHRVSTHETLEHLVQLGLVVKVYEPGWRIARRPAYYYLSRTGIRTVRKLLDVDESVVHALYKNMDASNEFVTHCLDIVATYSILKKSQPEGTKILAKAELTRFKELPKTRPDLYILRPDDQEAFVVFAHDLVPYIVWKRMEELINHFDEDNWEGTYPLIAFICKDRGSMHRLLRRTHKKLENMGIDTEDLMVVATTIDELRSGYEKIWSSVYTPKISMPLFG